MGGNDKDRVKIVFKQWSEYAHVTAKKERKEQQLSEAFNSLLESHMRVALQNAAFSRWRFSTGESKNVLQQYAEVKHSISVHRVGIAFACAREAQLTRTAFSEWRNRQQKKRSVRRFALKYLMGQRKMWLKLVFAEMRNGVAAKKTNMERRIRGAVMVNYYDTGSGGYGCRKLKLAECFSCFKENWAAEKNERSMEMMRRASHNHILDKFGAKGVKTCFG